MSQRSFSIRVQRDAHASTVSSRRPQPALTLKNSMHPSINGSIGFVSQNLENRLGTERDLLWTSRKLAFDWLELAFPKRPPLIRLDNLALICSFCFFAQSLSLKAC